MAKDAKSRARLWEKRVFLAQQMLLSPLVERAELKRLKPLLTKQTYEHVVEERSVEGLCGFPSCRRKLTSVPGSGLKRRISLGGIAKLGVGNCFCSDTCFRESVEFAGQLPMNPVLSSSLGSGLAVSVPAVKDSVMEDHFDARRSKEIKDNERSFAFRDDHLVEVGLRERSVDAEEKNAEEALDEDEGSDDDPDIMALIFPSFETEGNEEAYPVGPRAVENKGQRTRGVLTAEKALSPFALVWMTLERLFETVCGTSCLSPEVVRVKESQSIPTGEKDVEMTYELTEMSLSVISSRRVTFLSLLRPLFQRTCERLLLFHMLDEKFDALVSKMSFSRVVPSGLCKRHLRLLSLVLIEYLVEGDDKMSEIWSRAEVQSDVKSLLAEECVDDECFAQLCRLLRR